jgi:hypothetical protein
MPLKGSTKPRGYGGSHQKLRKAWARRVAAGLESCRRCGELIAPGEPFDLDHTDDRTSYLGPSHRKCNRQNLDASGCASGDSPLAGVVTGGWQLAEHRVLWIVLGRHLVLAGKCAAQKRGP